MSPSFGQKVGRYYNIKTSINVYIQNKTLKDKFGYGISNLPRNETSLAPEAERTLATLIVTSSHYHHVTLSHCHVVTSLTCQNSVNWKPVTLIKISSRSNWCNNSIFCHCHTVNYHILLGVRCILSIS